jgi:hypothetical protein
MAGKVICFFGLLLLTTIAYRTGDIYVFEFATSVTLVPWTLYLVYRKNAEHWTFYLWIITLGLICGICSLIRLGSAAPTLAMIVMLLLLGRRATVQSKGVFIIILLAGFMIPRIYFRYLLTRSDRGLQQSVPEYRAGDTRHVLGHFAYEGLGFLSNPYVPGGICDEVAKEKVQSIAPGAGYMSSDYNRILLREVVSIARQHPTLVAFTILAKLGIIIGLIVLFANIGLVAAFWYRLPWEIHAAFWTGFAISSAPLVLLAPLPMYCLGLISLAAIYGVIGLDYALASRKRSRSTPVLTQFRDDRAPALID